MSCVWFSYECCMTHISLHLVGVLHAGKYGVHVSIHKVLLGGLAHHNAQALVQEILMRKMQIKKDLL